MNKQNKLIISDSDYKTLLHRAVTEIKTTRNTVARQINSAANTVYWNLGKLLFEKKLEEAHGSGVVKQLSFDLKNEFPDMGLSPRNLWNMKRFFERYYQASTILLQLVAVLPRGHNLLLINKAQSIDAVEFYANETR